VPESRSRAAADSAGSSGVTSDEPTSGFSSTARGYCTDLSAGETVVEAPCGDVASHSRAATLRPKPLK
jgi:hypothetical protein